MSDCGVADLLAPRRPADGSRSPAEHALVSREAGQRTMLVAVRESPHMKVMIAHAQDIPGWLGLAAEVERLFGPLEASVGARSATKEEGLSESGFSGMIALICA